jgi:hypothetical protein
VIKPKAEFNASDAGSDRLYPNDQGKLVKLQIRNTGTDSARKMVVKLLPQYPFSSDGSVRYVENLEPGQAAPIALNINVDKDGSLGTYGLDLLIQYEDKEGNVLQDTTKLALTLRQKNIFQSVFLDYWFLWAIAIVAFLVIRKKRAQKKEPEARQKK